MAVASSKTGVKIQAWSLASTGDSSAQEALQHFVPRPNAADGWWRDNGLVMGVEPVGIAAAATVVASALAR